MRERGLKMFKLLVEFKLLDVDEVFSISYFTQEPEVELTHWGRIATLYEKSNDLGFMEYKYVEIK